MSEVEDGDKASGGPTLCTETMEANDGSLCAENTFY